MKSTLEIRRDAPGTLEFNKWVIGDATYLVDGVVVSKAVWDLAYARLSAKSQWSTIPEFQS